MHPWRCCAESGRARGMWTRESRQPEPTAQQGKLDVVRPESIIGRGEGR
jgi:hypothetical protein